MSLAPESHPVLAALQPEARSRLLAGARRLAYGDGEVLFREGEPGNSVYFLLQGTVRITVSSGEGGAEVLLASQGPGSVIGEMALLDPAPRSATATAQGDGVALGLSHEDFEDLLWSAADVATALLGQFAETLARRLRATDDAVHALDQHARSLGQPIQDDLAELWRLLWTGDT